MALIFVFLFLFLSINRCGKDGNETTQGDQTSVLFNPQIIYGTLTDQDGNTYKTVEIGTQTWMAENLKTTKYRNGEPIPNVTEDWDILNKGAYCNYNQDMNNGDVYGHLYNWYAVNDGRKIAPEGWHIPSDDEWTTLVNFLGGNSVAGGKLKETGIRHWFTSWYPHNVGATNETGFTALPGGSRLIGLFEFGHFDDIDRYGYWWSATQYTEFSAWWWSISNEDLDINKDEVGQWVINKRNGYSVRCVKD